MDLNFTVKLPSAAVSSNATRKEDNDKTLIWSLTASNQENITFTFELYNLPVIIGAGVVVLVIVIGVVLAVLNTNKKGKNNTTGATNQNMMNNQTNNMQNQNMMNNNMMGQNMSNPMDQSNMMNQNMNNDMNSKNMQNGMNDTPFNIPEQNSSNSFPQQPMNSQQMSNGFDIPNPVQSDMNQQ